MCCVSNFWLLWEGRNVPKPNLQVCVQILGTCKIKTLKFQFRKEATYNLPDTNPLNHLVAQNLQIGAWIDFSTFSSVFPASYHLPTFHVLPFMPHYSCTFDASSDIRGNSLHMPQYLSLFNVFPIGGQLPLASLGPSLLRVNLDCSTIL